MSSHSPQLGYNHNIPHRGRLYHVQTEDSGVDKAHIFTHIFYDGTIISSRKVEYREEVSGKTDASEVGPIVIGLMQDSHKTMIKSLRNGDFDEKIVAVIGEHPVEDNRASFEAAPAEGSERPERRPVPEPRDVESQGPPLSPGKPGPTVDPSVAHPVYASSEARAQVRASAAGHGPKRASRGPSRIRRRAIGGIGGGKVASEHQAQLDEDILTLLREDT